MTREQHSRANYISEAIIYLNQAEKIAEGATAIELYDKHSSDKYSNGFVLEAEGEVFRTMKEYVIKGLKERIVELEKEYEEL